MARLKKRLSLPEKHKTVTGVESRTKLLKIAEKCGVPRNVITWLLPGNKERKKKMLFTVVRLP